LSQSEGIILSMKFTLILFPPHHSLMDRGIMGVRRTRIKSIYVLATLPKRNPMFLGGDTDLERSTNLATPHQIGRPE
jgi:hypothetical protein